MAAAPPGSAGSARRPARSSHASRDCPPRLRAPPDPRKSRLRPPPEGELVFQEGVQQAMAMATLLSSPSVATHANAVAGASSFLLFGSRLN
ncbi:hypothetical protein U9M48_033199 [Paspalum notatum var. saurae]|uniref:Uncharacterized protein n=1 Tax=Paspalum notatum var. saurae TaxID=547442 RepID=A0AAQ3UAT5_PASNO